MSETYCGKNCAECADREALACPGCKDGPGKCYGGDCRLAKCCRDKGHMECTTCSFHEGCGTLRSRGSMPEHRLKALREEQRQAELLAKRAPVLGKWLWLLFWLIVPMNIASLMAHEQIAGILPALFLPGIVLNAVCILLRGVFLIKLGTVDELYSTAGICFLVGSSVNVVLDFIYGTAQPPAWTLLLSLPAMVIFLVSRYHEFHAHITALSRADETLAEKWRSLWKWYIGAYCVVFAGILLILIAPVLGAIIAFAALIAEVVVDIIYWVYLYRTAKLFRQYRPADTQE